ncbi:MAG: class II fructose-bisphosphate aldolase, partial [Oscillospiraceae bacterium]|nr:class II fructose-bisphosphate aldolase [Oscillospiraceae bacterium]
LDHCENFDGVMRAIKAGCSSVMIDASGLSFRENIELTQQVAKVAHAMGIPVEAELGKVGGKEDDLLVADGSYTDPAEAAYFVAETGVDMFAPAIGTAHGFYVGEPKLDFDRLAEIQRRTDVPLVLHGGSGLTDEQVKRCISLGIAKVNYATELRHAATLAVREVLQDEAVFDPKQFMGRAREAVEALCIQKITLCGSAGKVGENEMSTSTIQRT